MLEVTGLRVTYGSGALGVDDVSLKVAAGTVAVLLGPNGAGKTSTVRGIGGFLGTEPGRVVGGSVRLGDVDITGLEPHKTASKGLAVVPERRKVFPTLSVLENLTSLGVLPPKAERRAALDEILELFPALRERLGEQAGRLSGGQQQMLAIARALFARPKLLVIDEMTLGIHVDLHPVLFDAVAKIASRGTAVLLIDENAGTALNISDYCYMLRSGLVVAEGPPSSFADEDLIADLYLG